MLEETTSSSLKFWVSGNPAPFATSGEQPWRAALVSNLPQCSEGINERGLVIDFHLADLAPLGHPLDVDNLCEPVFSILINRKGWFSGRRPNLTWWRASNGQSHHPGCQIVVSQNDAASTGMPQGTPMFDAYYSGPLPVSARDPIMSEQIREKAGKQKTRSESRYFVFLRFDNPKLNIGDIATGKVKTMIDSLYPVIGGVRGQPEDWGVDILHVEKRRADLSGGIHISIWKLD